ncbi:MAG: hypothetical protein HQ518_14290 [Rhodopirellula sp.]|nr:hypothetical protein [Rhodopirellula sp.]
MLLCIGVAYLSARRFGHTRRARPIWIDYLRTENQVLKEKLGKKRILLDDDQRRHLAAKGMIMGRKRLEQVGTLFTPDTILRWHPNASTPRRSADSRLCVSPARQLLINFSRQSRPTTHSRSDV